MSGKVPLGISISVYDPIIVPGTSYTPQGRYLFNLANVVDSYSHTIEAFGGYTTAQFTFKAKDVEIDDWLERGLNRHIEVYNPYGGEIWEGFVNQLSYSVGGFSVVRGPLLDLANRVWCAYGDIDRATGTKGPTLETTLVNNLVSQARYGILERIIDAGERDNRPAWLEGDILRDAYMADQRVLTNKTWNPTGSSEPTLTVDCCGYVRRFERIYFIDAANIQITCTQAITLVVNADLAQNHLFAATNGSIGANAVLVPEQRPEYVSCDTVLKDIAAFGGPGFYRWLFYVGNGRYVTYRAVVNALSYIQELHDPAQRVRTINGGDVYPGDVWPGKWMFFPDFAIGRIFEGDITDLPTDPRAMFIESVTFTAPDQLDISGSKSDKLSAMLKEYGIGGI